MSADTHRYTAVAIVLHWAIAVAIAGMIPLGWWMGDALENPATQAQAIAAFQLHKSVGLVVLALSLLRLGWRLAHPAPPLPDTMKPWERLAATATHIGFYILIIVMPLTGWLYVSTAWSVHDGRPLDVPTLFFGLFRVPHLFGLAETSDATRAAAAGGLEFVHSKLAWGAIALAVLHVGAALKHQIVDKDGVLARMLPFLAPRTPGEPQARTFALLAGTVAIALGALGALWLFANPPTGPAAAPASAMHTHGEGEDHHDEALASDAEAAPAAETHTHADGAVHVHAPAAQPDQPAPPAGPPPLWRVTQGASSIAFTGTHAGVPFEGRFSAWRAEIRFDPDNLPQSSAVVTIDTASARDGVPLHDQSLPGAEWFDAANHPNAVFRTTSIRARGDAYEAQGTLTIKGRAIDIALPFTLRIEGGRAVMDGNARISRREADLGMESDPDAAYVSADIGVRVHVEATRAP